MDAEKTKVVFRKWRGNIIALFPEEPSDILGRYCLSYQHIGQHGDADYAGIVADSYPAMESEYADLKEELEKIGYVLDIRQRCTPAMRQASREQVRQWRTAL